MKIISRNREISPQMKQTVYIEAEEEVRRDAVTEAEPQRYHIDTDLPELTDNKNRSNDLTGGSHIMGYNNYNNFGSKTGYSRNTTDLFGNTRTKHYDSNGNCRGYSRQTTDLFGNTRTKHYDNNGNSRGYSQRSTDLFGNTRAKHYDNSGSSRGYSQRSTDLFGNSRVNHYDKSGRKTGYSQKKYW